MEIVRDTFGNRKSEIEQYFNLIDFFDSAGKEIKKQVNETVFNNKNIERIVRANAFLMLYNLVESTLVTGIEEVYSVLKQDGISYIQVRQEIKDIWFNYKFSNAYDKNAHFHTYRNTALKIINSILLNEPIILERKATGISGNLDADSIRNVCKTHGIIFRTPKDCHGGEKLCKVKEQRNQLAHGSLSFVECGSYFTANDLHEIKNEVVIFLEGFIEAIEQYYDNKDYLVNL